MTGTMVGAIFILSLLLEKEVSFGNPTASSLTFQFTAMLYVIGDDNSWNLRRTSYIQTKIINTPKTWLFQCF